MNRHDLFRSKFLILISFLITFTLLYLFSYIKGLEVLEINSNGYLTEDSKSYEIIVKNEDELGTIKDIIKEMDVVSIKKEDGLVLSYFNEKSLYKPTYSLLSDVEISESYNILLGKDLYDSYLKSEDSSYELFLKDTSIYCNVIGVLESGKFDFKDFSSYVLIDLDNESIDDFNGVYSIDGNTINFESILSKSSIEFKEVDINFMPLSGSRFLSVQSIFISIIVLLFIFTMILIVKVWFNLYMKEAGIRIAFGGTKRGLFFYIIGKYLLAIIIGVLFSLILFSIYYYLFLRELDIRALILPISFVVILVFGFSLITAIINYILFSRKSVREIIEE